MAGVAGSWTTWADQKGRVVRESNPLNQTTAWEYDKSGAPVVVRRSNGTETQYEYDFYGRMAQMRHRARTAAGTALTTLEQLVYGYDALGRVTSEQAYDGTRNYNWTFTYDRVPSGRGAVDAGVGDDDSAGDEQRHPVLV